MSKKTILTILAILIIPILAFWGLSLGRSSEAVASTGIPQVLKFSSTMCIECKQVEKIFNEIMPQYSDKVKYTSIIVDSGKDMNHKLIKKYNIQLVPTVILLNSDGNISKRIEGAVSKDKYIECIESLK